MHRQSIIQCPDSFTIRNEMHVNVIMLQFDCSFTTSLYKSYSWTTRTSRCCLSPRQDPIHVQMQSRSQTYKKMRKSAIKIRNVVVFLFFILNLERKKYRAVLWAWWDHHGSLLWKQLKPRSWFVYVQSKFTYIHWRLADLVQLRWTLLVNGDDWWV